MKIRLDYMAIILYFYRKYFYRIIFWIMMSLRTVSKLFIITLLFMSCCAQQDEWIQLFNGQNLENWDTYKPADAGDISLEKLFSVVEMDGMPAMRISGEINAAIGTKETYENYHLQMEFKWGDEVTTKRNSGLLYHGYGPYGKGLGVWMNSHELQLWTGNMGDSYRMGDTYCQIPATETDSAYYVWDENAAMQDIGKNGVTKIVHKTEDLEKPVGQWNVVDLYCFGDQSVHVVNGETVMANYKSGKYEGDQVTPLTSGKIQLQSEGGELFVKSIKLRPIETIPAEVL